MRIYEEFKQRTLDKLASTSSGKLQISTTKASMMCDEIDALLRKNRILQSQISGRPSLLVTFPRSGTVWTMNRLRTFLMMYRDMTGPLCGGMGKRIQHTHAGFHPFTLSEGKNPYFDNDQRTFVLLRDARKVLVSNWHWLIDIVDRGVNPVEFVEHPIPDNISDFIRGPRGVVKFQNFLRLINSYKQKGILEDVFYYEEADGPDFIRQFPEVMGLDFEPSDDFIARVIEENSEMVNHIDGTDHDAVPKKDLAYIQKELKKDCPLQEYADRYL